MTVLKWNDYRGIFDSIRHIGVMEIRGLSDVECYSKYWKDSTVEIELEMEEGKKIVEYEIVPRDKMSITYSLKVLKVYKTSTRNLPENIARQFEDKKRVILGMEIEDVRRAICVIKLLVQPKVEIVKILDLEELLKDIVVYRPNNVFAPFVVRVEGVYSYFAFISPKLL